MDPATVGMVITLITKFGVPLTTWIVAEIGLLIDRGSTPEDAAKVAIGKAEDLKLLKAEIDALHE